MGSFDATCAVSSLPIGSGEKVVLLPVMTRQKIGSSHPMCTRLFHTADLLCPIFLPLKGTYQDYGSFFAEDEDWGLITSDQGLERVRTHFISGDGEGDLFAYREVPDVYNIPRRSYDDYDTWVSDQHGVDVLAIRAEVWDYFTAEHRMQASYAYESPTTFAEKWPPMEEYLRRYFLPENTPTRFQKLNWDEHDVLFNIPISDLEQPLARDLDLYCQSYGYDIESFCMPGPRLNGLPTKVREWLSGLIHNEDLYVRCLDEPAFLDNNFKGMRLLAESLHVLFSLGRMRRLLTPVSGTGSQSRNWQDSFNFFSKMRDIALSKMVQP